MASGHAAHGNGHGHTGKWDAHGDPNSPFHIHHPNPMLYLYIYLALLALLGVTVVLYYFDFSERTGWVGTNLVIAMVVAIIKAYLVVMFFMNVRGSTRLTWLWAALGFIWLLLMGGIFMDYQTRNWVDQSGWQEVPSEWKIPAKHMAH